MIKHKSKAHSAVDRVARELRTVVLAVEPGEYIGSEASLSQQFEVTGPTLRQAVRLLEHEELIRVKRGLKGGYFASRPDLETISRVAATYVRGNLQSLDEIGVLLEYIQPLLVDLVISSDRLGELACFADPGSIAEAYGEFVDIQTRFADLFWDMSDNVPIRLIYAIFFQVGRGIDLKPVTALSPAMRGLDQQRVRLARALIEKDRETAIELAIAQCRTVHGGLKASLVAGRSGKAGPTSD